MSHEFGGAVTKNYSYDTFGRVTQLQKVVNSTTYTTSYAYNLANQLTLVTYPSGRVVQQNLDTIGRLSSVAGTLNSVNTTYASGFAYNTAGQVTAFNYGNGVVASFGFSADRLQLTSLSYAKSTTTLLSLAYSHGAAGSNNGQILGITDNTGTAGSGALGDLHLRCVVSLADRSDQWFGGVPAVGPLVEL